MIKHSLFAGQEREAKLNELGDTLRVLGQHIDFAALAAKSIKRRRAQAATAVAAHRFQPN